MSFPLAVSFFANDIKKWLPAFFTLFWIFNLVIILRGGETIGLPGNQNWHAALLLVTTPFVVYLSYSLLCRLKINTFTAAFLSALPAILIFRYFINCHARAAFIGIIASIAFLSFFYFPTLKKFLRPIYIVIFAVLSVAVILAFIFLHADKLAEAIFIDVRLPLWHGALKMAMDNLTIGVGVPRFESSYAQYRDVNYFLRSAYYAVRSSHPHNQLLYILCCFGLAGAAAWFYLWIFPVIKGCRKFSALDSISKICLVTYGMLLIHSMFDLVLAVWPTMFFGGILLGILWKELGIADISGPTPSQDANGQSMPILGKFCILSASVILVIYIVMSICINITSSYHMRNSWINLSQDKSKALAEAEKSFMLIKDPVEIYHSAIVAQKTFNDHLLSMHFLKMLEGTPAPVIAHSNAYKANYFIKTGRFADALDSLEKESRNFPLSIVNLHNKLFVENKLGLHDAAEMTKLKLADALKYKGLAASDIPEILKNPYYDDKFDNFRTGNAPDK